MDALLWMVQIHLMLWGCILTDPHDSLENRQKTTEKILNNDFPLLIDSIDDYESIIADFGFATKIYKRSLLENNSINFPSNYSINNRNYSS